MDEDGAFVVLRSPSGYSAGWRRRYQGAIAGGERGVITRLSSSSRRRLTRYMANCRAKYRYLGTLTVRDYSLDGSRFKAHVDVYLRWFLARMRRLTTRAGGDAEKDSILWWLEFQERGAPHLHFVYTARVPWRDASAHWAKVIGDETIAGTATRFEKIRCIEAMPSYIAKYAIKLEQKDVPQGYRSVGRFWGVRGYREVREAALVAKSSETAERLQLALAKAAEKEVSRGTATVKVWMHGSGVTILKAKGQPGLEPSGALARIEIELMKEAATAELLLVEPLPQP